MLGRFPLPVEVIPMARSYVARELVRLGGHPAWRIGFTTDNGNVILDVSDLAIRDPVALEDRDQPDRRRGHRRPVRAPRRRRHPPRRRHRRADADAGAPTLTRWNCIVNDDFRDAGFDRHRRRRRLHAATSATRRATRRAPSRARRRNAKNLALRAIAAALRRDAARLLDANAHDVARARAAGHDAAFVDRLTLTERSIEAMARGLEEIVALPDPVGEITDLRYRPSGIQVGKMRVPLGVIGIIYESRPNVTADAAGAVPQVGQRDDPARRLRGAATATARSPRCVHEACATRACPSDAVQVVATTDRAAVGYLIADEAHVDVIVPRGGKALIERVAREARCR